jgi:hypothetical protein
MLRPISATAFAIATLLAAPMPMQAQQAPDPAAAAARGSEHGVARFQVGTFRVIV